MGGRARLPALGLFDRRDDRVQLIVTIAASSTSLQVAEVDLDAGRPPTSACTPTVRVPWCAPPRPGRRGLLHPVVALVPDQEAGPANCAPSVHQFCVRDGEAASIPSGRALHRPRLRNRCSWFLGTEDGIRFVPRQHWIKAWTCGVKGRICDHRPELAIRLSPAR